MGTASSTVRLPLVKKAIAVAIQAGEPVLVWGEPGVGKSSGIKAICSALDLPLEVVIGSIREATDIGGLPIRAGSGVRLLPPDWALRAARRDRTAVFFDEITTAPSDVQAAMLAVVLDRVVGDLQLPDGVAFVAAANPPSSGGIRPLSAPLANRFCHLTWALDPHDWANGTAVGWPKEPIVEVPTDRSASLGRWTQLTTSFIRHRPDLLMATAETDRSMAWPSPRSWSQALRLAAAAEAAGTDEDVRHTLVSGCVGVGPAMEFHSFVRSLDLTDPAVALADPDLVAIPESADRCHALLQSVATLVAQSNSERDWRSAWRLVGRIADQRGADVAVTTAMQLARLRRAEWSPPQEVDRFRPVLVGINS